MTMAMNPAHMRYRLRTQLRSARIAAELTQAQVAESLDWHPSKLLRIENGDVSVSTTDLRALVQQYGIEARYSDLADLARGSRRQPWGKYRDVLTPETIKFFGFEASAQLIRLCQNSMIPGLLQTPDYTRALLTEAYGFTKEDAERHLEVRLERQELLTPGPSAPKAFFILDESVLHRAVGGQDVMRQQLDRLRQLASRPQVTIQVLPLASGATFAMRGPFVYLEFDDDPDVLYLEGSGGERVFRNQLEVTEQYRLAFQKLETLAPDLTSWAIDQPGSLRHFTRS